jgi:acyl-CoA reductase-like NAD-dependent aldehyde dehydrogenase
VKLINEIPLQNIGTTTPNKFIQKILPLDMYKFYNVPDTGIDEISLLFNNIKTNFRKKIGVISASKILLNTCAELLMIESDINYCVQYETAKPMKLIKLEFEAAINFMSSLAGFASFQNGIVIPSKNINKTVYTKNSPYGIACLITSHNTPLPNYAWKLAPSFLSGNYSILKPSEHTSMSAQLFVECFLKAGAPDYVVNLVHGGSNTVKTLIEQKPELISFTGSSATGTVINKLASTYSPKIILEMGGSNPMIICETANLEKAVEVIIDSAFSNAGQRCASGSRLIVHKNVYHQLLSMIENKLNDITIGISEESYYGGVISNKSVDAHNQYLEKAKKNGLQVREYGKIENSSIPIFLRPSIIEVPVDFYGDYIEEVFSPILRLSGFENNNEAVDLANMGNYGLTAAVWTRNLEDSAFFSSNIESGVVNINGPTHGAEFQFPFGGLKNSGNGTKEVGYSCLGEYSFTKIISVTSHD